MHLRFPFAPTHLALGAALAIAGCADAHAPVPPADGALFVAVGTGGAILTSPDGRAWTREVSGVDVGLSDVAFGDGVLVAVGGDGTVLSSVDGHTWSPRSVDTDVHLAHVVHVDGRFVAAGGSWESGGAAVVSDDGATWRTLPPLDRHMFHGVAVIEGDVVVSANLRSDLLTPAVFRFHEREGAWGAIPAPSFHSSTRRGDATLVVGGASVHRSIDGWTWTASEIGSAEIHGIAWTGSELLVADGSAAIHGSTDGETWTMRAAPDEHGATLLAIASGSGTTVAVGNDGLVLVSRDLTTWDHASVDAAIDLGGIAHARWDP